jgi:hypothetical protein
MKKTRKQLEQAVVAAAMARYVEWVYEGGRPESEQRTRKLRNLAHACEALHVAGTAHVKPF